MTISSLRLTAAALLAAVASFLLPTVASAQTPGRSFRGAYDLTTPNFQQQFVLFVGKNSLAYCVYADYDNRSVGFATFAINSAGQFSFATNNGKAISGTFTETGVTGNATTFGAFNGARQFFRTTGMQSAGCFNGWDWFTADGSLNMSTWIILPSGRTYVISFGFNNAPEDGGVGTTSVDGSAAAGGRTYPFNFKSVLNAREFSGTATLFEGVLGGSYPLGNGTVRFSMPRENTTYHLINLSTRGFVNTGDGVLIAGFVVSGGAKRVVIRALGPSLAGAVAGTLSDPTLQINAGASVLTTNDNWRTDANSSQITALGLAPTSDFESAVILNLEAGSYTAIVRGAGNATGIALVEVYEVD